ncbi:hypothetical protein TNCV_4715031 [Trichonephila clavipes]|nr:hypothetical protein TNCV_4715031 [Trichonephila clavipes]
MAFKCLLLCLKSRIFCNLKLSSCSFLNLDFNINSVDNWFLFPHYSGHGTLVDHRSLVTWYPSDMGPSGPMSRVREPLCKDAMHVKSVESLKVLPLVWQLGERGAIPGVVFDHGSKLRGLSPTTLM